MEKTKLDIPEEVIDRANSLRESWRGAEADQVIAEWARNEALREAAEVARTTALTLDDIGYEAEVIAQGILELIEEEA